MKIPLGAGSGEHLVRFRAMRLKNFASSLINAMFTSRWMFLKTFEASATLIEVARCLPAVPTRA